MPKTDTRETMVNVKEATGSDAPSSEFVRQGLVAIQAVNRGLNRMQAELAYLVNSATQQAANRGIIVVGGTPQSNPYAAFGQAPAYATPWATNPFTPGIIGPQSAFTPMTIPGAQTSFTPVTIPTSSPWTSGFPVTGAQGIPPTSFG